jgi:branched-chain amino acid transport system permease protein
MAVVGGLGTLIGPAIGAVIVFAFKTVFWAYLSDYQVLYLIILGAAIALTVVFLPNGLWGTYMGRRESSRNLKKELADRPRIDEQANADQAPKGESDHV